MSEDAVRQFVRNHPDAERRWSEMSDTERRWWTRKYQRAQERIRESLGSKPEVYR